MDIIKEKIYKDGKFKDVLARIDKLLEGKKPLSVLVTSSAMTRILICNGFHKLYENKINFVHTLGCPYCYTDKAVIEKAIILSKKANTYLVTKVNNLYISGFSSCAGEEITDNNIKIINRETEALDIARLNPDKDIILFSSGFESITPAVSGLITEAKEVGINNLKVIMNNKLLPPAVRNLLNKNIQIDGYLAPGDISIVIGTGSWQFLVEEFRIPVVISGFGPREVLVALEKLLLMIDHAECIVENSYSSLVNSKGNPLAQEKTYRVFRPKTVSWRGYGLIPFSGLTFNTEFEEFDASKLLDETPYKKLIEDCRAAEILCNKSLPGECDYYKKHCTPSHPKDVCMAMEDGLCHIFYSTDEELLPSLNSYYRLID